MALTRYLSPCCRSSVCTRQFNLMLQCRVNGMIIDHSWACFCFWRWEIWVWGGKMGGICFVVPAQSPHLTKQTTVSSGFPQTGIAQVWSFKTKWIMSQLLKKEFRWLKKKRFNNAHTFSILCKFGPVGSEIFSITLFFNTMLSFIYYFYLFTFGCAGSSLLHTGFL